MGWAFQDLSLHDDAHEDDDVDRVHREHKRREHTHTAFDKRVDVPADFVGPSRHHTRPTPATQPLHHARHSQKTNKTTMVHSAAYSKRATGPTARSVAASASASTRHDTAAKRPAAGVSEAASRSSRPHRQRSRSPPSVQNPPVDFVYDVDVRRKLRERMDAERFDTLRKAVAKEATLRAEHKWVRNGASTRKEAWPTATTTTTTTTGSESPVRVTPTRIKPRPVSAKTAIAPNVSEWRTQETPFHFSIETQRAQTRQREAAHRAQQTREAHEVAQSIDAFERRALDGWSDLDTA